MRSVYMLPGLILMLAFAGAIVVSCSLASYQPQFVVTVSAAQTGRSGPALSQMSHYILAVSGPNTNSLNDSDVQGRSLDCLGLKGQVFFPLTYSQLLSGVQASLALGDYQFTLIGFDGSAVASPASVAELVGGSPNLKAYRLAQASASIGKSQTLELAPAYDAASAPDLLTQCPKAAYSLHALLEKSSQVFYFTNSSGSWVANQVDPLGGQNLGSLYVDASAKAHVTYGTTGTSVGVRYSTNSSGTFSPRAQVATSGQTGGFDYSAIVLDKLNTPIVLSNDSTLGSGNVLGKTYENQGSGFILGSSVFTIWFLVTEIFQ